MCVAHGFGALKLAAYWPISAAFVSRLDDALELVPVLEAGAPRRSEARWYLASPRDALGACVAAGGATPIRCGVERASRTSGRPLRRGGCKVYMTTRYEIHYMYLRYIPYPKSLV